jgi:hypothetical protein
LPHTLIQQHQQQQSRIAAHTEPYYVIDTATSIQLHGDWFCSKGIEPFESNVILFAEQGAVKM